MNRLPAHADAVVALRAPELLAPVRDLYRRAKLILWSHDHPHRLLCAEFRAILELRPIIVAVSRTHRDQLAAFAYRLASLVGERFDRRLVRFIYNPLDDTIAPASEPYDPWQLVFTSSPHKGLTETLQLFAAVRRREPRFRLWITNPGYVTTSASAALPAGVRDLGVLARHRDVLRHVAASLCVFYPNYSVPEEFGLVFSESNAVGTPVLAHDHGAAREVLRPRSQVMDCRDRQAVVRRVLAWADGERPKVAARPEFAMSAVIREWCALLDL